MTTTVALANLPTNPIDVSVHRFANGDFAFRKTGDSDDGSTYSEYIFTGGDQSIETTATFRQYPADKAGVIRNSMRLRTVQTVTTDSVVTESAPVDVIVSWSVPGLIEDSAAIMKMIGCAFGLTFKTLSTKVPQTEVVSGLNRRLFPALMP